VVQVHEQPRRDALHPRVATGRRARAWPLAALLLSTACAPQETLLSPPQSDTARAAVVAVLGAEGALVEVRAADPRGAWAVRAAQDGAEEVLVLYYDRTLTELALAEGPVARELGAPCTRAAPREVWRSTVADATFTPTALPSTLADWLAPEARTRCGRCRTLEERRVDVPGRLRRPEAAAPLSDGDVLILGDPGSMWALGLDRVDTISGCPARAYESLHGFGVDHFFAGVYGGAIDILAIDARTRTCTVVGQRVSTATRTIEWMDSSPDGQELVALDVGGRLHFSAQGGALAVVADLPLHYKFTRPEGTNRGSVVWLGPGHFVANASAAEIMWWRDGQRVRTESVRPLFIGDTVSDLTMLEDGLYVGDGGGQIVRVREDGSGPEPLANNPLDEIVGAIVPDLDGFVATTGAGRVGPYYPSVGWCPPHTLVGATDRGHYAFVDKRGNLVLPDMVGNEIHQPQVVWLIGRD
jgi:hypothetical protein